MLSGKIIAHFSATPRVAWLDFSNKRFKKKNKKFKKSVAYRQTLRAWEGVRGVKKILKNPACLLQINILIDQFRNALSAIKRARQLSQEDGAQTAQIACFFRKRRPAPNCDSLPGDEDGLAGSVLVSRLRRDRQMSHNCVPELDRLLSRVEGKRKRRAK